MAAYLAGHESTASTFTPARIARRWKRRYRQAARSAFWIAFALHRRAREITRASGWAARARRLLEEDRHDCVECGYVMVPQALEQIRRRPRRRGGDVYRCGTHWRALRGRRI